MTRNDASRADPVLAVDRSRSSPEKTPAASALSPSGAGDAPTPPRPEGWAVTALRTIAANMRSEGLAGSRPDVLDEAANALTVARTARDRAEQEREAMAGQLRTVDALMARIPALDPYPTRYEKIGHMLRMLRATNAPASPAAAVQPEEGDRR